MQTVIRIDVWHPGFGLITPFIEMLSSAQQGVRWNDRLSHDLNLIQRLLYWTNRNADCQALLPNISMQDHLCSCV